VNEDFYYELQGHRFVWDKGKATRNKTKHGIVRIISARKATLVEEKLWKR